MVKLQTSLLAVTLATGSALAYANEFQRRGESDVNNQGPIPNFHLRFGLALAKQNNLQPRGFVDEDDLFVRDDAFDDVEARTISSKSAKQFKTAVDVGIQAYSAYQAVKSRGLEDDEDLFVRDLDALDDLEAREPGGGAINAVTGAFKFGMKLSKHKNTRHALKALNTASDVVGDVQTLNSRGLEDDEDLFVRDDAFDDVEARAIKAKHLKTAVDIGIQAYTAYQSVNSRGLEDDEDLFVRDLDALDDLEAREPGGGAFKAVTGAFKFGMRLGKHKHTRHALKALNTASDVVGDVQTLNSRGLEDDEDLFVRDLDALDDLEAREPGGGAINAITGAFKFGMRLGEHKHAKHLKTAIDVGTDAYQTVNSRGLEDDEDIFVRDLDTEELFGREYDLLDERDTFDDLD